MAGVSVKVSLWVWHLNYNLINQIFSCVHWDERRRRCSRHVGLRPNLQPAVAHDSQQRWWVTRLWPSGMFHLTGIKRLARKHRLMNGSGTWTRPVLTGTWRWTLVCPTPTQRSVKVTFTSELYVSPLTDRQWRLNVPIGGGGGGGGAVVVRNKHTPPLLPLDELTDHLLWRAILGYKSAIFIFSQYDRMLSSFYYYVFINDECGQMCV